MVVRVESNSYSLSVAELEVKLDGHESELPEESEKAKCIAKGLIIEDDAVIIFMEGSSKCSSVKDVKDLLRSEISFDLECEDDEFLGELSIESSGFSEINAAIGEGEGSLNY